MKKISVLIIIVVFILFSITEAIADYCQKCGAMNSSDAQFCTKCGTKIFLSQPNDIKKPQSNVKELIDTFKSIESMFKVSINHDEYRKKIQDCQIIYDKIIKEISNTNVVDSINYSLDVYKDILIVWETKNKMTTYKSDYESIDLPFEVYYDYKKIIKSLKSKYTKSLDEFPDEVGIPKDELTSLYILQAKLKAIDPNSNFPSENQQKLLKSIAKKYDNIIGVMFNLAKSKIDKIDSH